MAALLIGATGGSAVGTNLPTAGPLPIDVTPLPLPLPTPSASPSAPPLPGVGTSLPGTSLPGASVPGAPATTGTAATDVTGAPVRPVYQPSADEQQVLPNEPNRIAYEQQLTDVAFDQQELMALLSPIAVDAGGGSGRFGWPLVVHGRPPLTQRYGCTDLAGEPYNAECPSHRWHTGIDFGEPEGTPVFAADSGVVREFRSGTGYGNYILLVHGNGYATLYGHLRAFVVPDGQVVKRGDPIGLVGSTGFSTGPHLHFEIRYDSSYIDPCAELRC